MPPITKISRKDKVITRYIRKIGYDAVRKGLALQQWTETDKETYDRYKVLDISEYKFPKPCSNDEFMRKLALIKTKVPTKYQEMWETYSGIQPRYLLRDGLIDYGVFATKKGIPYDPEKYTGKIVSNVKILGIGDPAVLHIVLPKEETETSDYYTDPSIEYTVPKIEILQGIKGALHALSKVNPKMDKDYLSAVQPEVAKLNSYIDLLTIAGHAELAAQVLQVKTALRQSSALAIRHLVYGGLSALY